MGIGYGAGLYVKPRFSCLRSFLDDLCPELKDFVCMTRTHSADLYFNLKELCPLPIFVGAVNSKTGRTLSRATMLEQ